MEISVRIERVLDVLEVASRQSGNVYKKYSFIGSTINEQYPKRICFTVFGEDKWAQMGGLEVGRSYSLSFDLSSREYNGRWYTEASVWKAVAIDGQSVQQSPYAQPQVASTMSQGVQQPQAQQQQQYAQPTPQPQPQYVAAQPQPQASNDLPF